MVMGCSSQSCVRSGDKVGQQCQQSGGEAHRISLEHVSSPLFAREGQADATLGIGYDGEDEAPMAAGPTCQWPAAPGLSYCWINDLRAAESTARPSALLPSARASWSDPTSVPATTLAAARGAAGSVERTKAMRRCTQTADAS